MGNKSKLYSIMDTKVGAFGAIHTDTSDVQAVRGLQTAVNEKSSGHLYTYAEDYQLYLMGEFDHETGIIKLQSPPKMIVVAKSLQRENNQL